MVKGLSSKVRSGVLHAAPGLTCGQKALLGLAGIFRFSRKIRILKKKENIIPYAVGSFLDAVTRSNPTLQQVARIPFASLSILRCVEDLAEIRRLAILAGRLLTGKEYVVVKKDRFTTSSNKGLSPSLRDKIRWWLTVFKEQIKLFFKIIGEIFKRFFQLILHLGDVYTAFTDNMLPEVFIHSRDLWKMLSSQDSNIVKHLKRTQNINDWVLEKMGSPKKTAFLLNLFSLPAKIKEKLPDPRDVKAGIVKFGQDYKAYFEASSEYVIATNYEFVGGDKTQLHQKYWVFTEGSEDDPRVNRFIKPPVMKGIQSKGKVAKKSLPVF